MDLVRALKFPFDDEDWPAKLALGSLITLLPVIGWIAGVGYQVGVARGVMRGAARPLPGSDELGQIFSDGVKAGLAGLLYALPIVPVWLIIAILQARANGSGADDVALVAVSVLFALLTIAYSLLAAAMYWAGVIRFIQTGEFSEFTQFRALWGAVRANLRTLASLLLYTVLLSLILAVISPLALVTCIGIFVIAFYSQIASGHLLGQAGRQMVRGYQPV